jgi:uncharacterized protein YgbK (DUF1537 family)
MIAVIADDISGAAELAGAALRHGLRAEVQTVFDPRSDADVICVDTDSRSRSVPAAGHAAGDAARRVAEARPAWIYKKCDSVMRGHVLAELRAIMAASGHLRAMLVPANPSRGRVIRGGHLLVNGQPLHTTDFACDPEHPRTTSRVTELLGHDLAGVIVPDVSDEADLLRQAALVDDSMLAAGGVEFFEALLTRHGSAPVAGANVPLADGQRPARPGEGISPPVTLVICGSAAAWSKRRQQARERGIPAFSLPHDVAEITGALRSNRCALIGIGEGPLTQGKAPSDLVGQLAQAGAAVLRDVSVERLLLEGGATAATVVRELGWTRLCACEVAAPGIGTLRPFGLAAPIVSIKPGSYDWPADLWRPAPRRF